jgi:hypothetical protein
VREMSLTVNHPGVRILKIGLVLTLFSFPVLWLYPYLYNVIAIRPVLDVLAIFCQIGLIVGFVLLAYGVLKAVLYGSNRETNWWAWQTGPFK